MCVYVRKDEPRLTKPHIEVPTGKSRKVSDRVPKVPRSTIEERLQQLALEAPKPPPAPEPGRSWLPEDRTLSGRDLETSKRMPLPPIPASPHSVPSQAWSEKGKGGPEFGMEEQDKPVQRGATTSDSDAFFMTQLDYQEEESRPKQKPEKVPAQSASTETADDVNNSNADRYRGYELLLDLDPDDDIDAELPKDIQGNIRALKHVLGHALVYRDPSVDLDRVKRTVPEFRRVPMPPAKPHKSRQERVDDVLHTLRTRSTIQEEDLNKVLKDPRHLGQKYPEAQNLLGQIQRRYNSVRVSSMKEAHEARKIIDQAFEVLNKPRQTYKACCMKQLNAGCFCCMLRVQF
nr:hypothetical protein BaRGS_005825 [Batillaria attramentaria]